MAKVMTDQRAPAFDDDVRIDDDAGVERGNPELVQVVDACRALYTNSLFSERTQKEYENMIQEFALDGDIEKIRQNIGWLNDAIRDAEQSEKEFASKLDDAAKNKWISAASKEKWLDRFRNFEGLEFQRKYWVREHFDVYVNNWKEAAAKRTEVLAFAKAEGVTAKEVPELWAVETDEVFLELHYRNRKQSVSAVRAAILARKYGLQALHREARSLLVGVSGGAGRCLHRSKVGLWMERMFASGNPQLFMDQTLKPYVRNWQTVRGAFDLVDARMKEKGVPRGFTPVSLDAFLLMTYDQRDSYTAELAYRLEATELNEIQDLANFKMGIRHELDTKFWEGAERLLDEANKRFKGDPELASMQRYLDAHRTQHAKEGTEGVKDASAIQEEMKNILAADIPTCTHLTYQTTLAAGPAAFGALAASMFNRVWVHEHGYSDELQDLKDAKSAENKNRTKKYIEEGHEGQKEKNIVSGSTAVDEAICDECTGPQTVYTDGSTESQLIVARKSIENQGNFQYKFWTSFNPPIPYAQQEFIVKHVNNRLKSLAWKLKGMGFAFSAFGPPTPLN